MRQRNEFGLFAGSLGDDVDVVPVVIHVDEGGLLSVVGWGLI